MSAVSPPRGLVELRFPAFPALRPTARASTMSNDYERLQVIATNGFADELVAAAVALCLRVNIMAMPFTPRGAAQWKISEYQPTYLYLPMKCSVFLGIDDLHYVWLPVDSCS